MKLSIPEQLEAILLILEITPKVKKTKSKPKEEEINIDHIPESLKWLVKETK